MNRACARLRPIVLPVLLIAAVVLARRLGFAGKVSSMSDWAEGLGAKAILIFVAAHVVRAVCFLPSSLFCIVAGAAFGFWTGLLASYAGLICGAAVGYGLARCFLSDFVRRRIDGRAERIVEMASSHGLLGMTLARSFSMIPFDIFNYIAGAVRVSFPLYLGGTALGLWPGMAFYVFLGSALGMEAKSSPVGFVLLPVMLLGAVLFWRAAARRLCGQLERSDRECT